MKSFIFMCALAFSVSMVACNRKNYDSRLIGDQLIQLDKTQSLWEGSQAASVYTAKSKVQDDDFFSRFDGKSGYDTLNHQKSLLQKFNSLDKEIRDEAIASWIKHQLESLNILRNARGVSSSQSPSDPLEIINEQQNELKLLDDKRQKLKKLNSEIQSKRDG